jgi:hypothetical protein
MNGIELKEDLPGSFSEEAEKMGVEERDLRGRLKPPLLGRNEENRVEVERVVHYIKETVFPRVKG